MEVQEIKEQLKEIFRTVINNDKWITIHPNGEDAKGRHLLLKDGESPKEAIERTYGKKDNISKDYKENTSHYGKKEHQEEIISLYEGLKNPDKSEARKKEDKELLEHHLKELSKYSDTSGIHLSDEETKRENKIKEIKKELNKKQSDTKEESKKSKIDFSEYSDAELEHAIDVYKSNLSTAMEYGDAQYNAEKDMLSEIEKELGRRKAKSDTKDGKEEKKSTFKPVKGIMQSLKDDYEAGKINAKEVAKELSKANLTPYLLDDNEALEKIGVKQSDSKGDSKDDELVNVTEDYYNRISKEELQKEFKDIQKEFAKWKDKKNFPEYKGYKNKLLRIKDIYEKRFGKSKADNSKEQDMALIEELKKLITKVENTKGEKDMDEKEKVDNKKVDKRKLIDEVGGILKGKVDDEIIRTIMKKMEEASYNGSEDDKADNEKEEDKKEVKEIKEDVKEDIDNKCKNSKPDTSSFDKINEIYNSIKQVTEESNYVSRQEKLDNAVEYFK